MKRSNFLIRVMMFIVTAIGVFGYNLISANDVTMNYTESNKVAASLLGINDEFGTEDDNDEYDLGRISRKMRNRTIDLRTAGKRIAKAKGRYERMVNRSNATAILTPSQKFLVGKRKSWKNEAQKLLESGALEYVDGFIYYNKEYTTVSGNVEIIQSNDTIGVGYSNLNDNGIVPEQLQMSVDYVEFGTNAYDSVSANLIETAWTPAYDNVYLKNAELEIIVGGKVVQMIPVQMMKEVRTVRGAVAGAVYDEMGMGYNLEKPILIPGGSQINFNLKMPTGGTGITNTSTNRDGLHILLAGAGTKRK